MFELALYQADYTKQAMTLRGNSVSYDGTISQEQR